MTENLQSRCLANWNMEMKLDPAKDDLPLMANTRHMLVKHYVLDLDVDFKSQVIEGTIVLFFEPGSRCKKGGSAGEGACLSRSYETCKIRASEPCHSPVTNVSACSSKTEYNDFAVCAKGEKDTSDKNGNHSNSEQASGISSSKNCYDIENHGNEDFLLVLDCCDLSVLKVEEVDVAAVPGIEKFTRSAKLTGAEELRNLRNQIVHELVTLPADHWREQLYYYTRCSQAPGCGELLFSTGPWSLMIGKAEVQAPRDFPHAIRIWYKTKPEGRSVTWTTDQSSRLIEGSCGHVAYPCRFQNPAASSQLVIPHRIFAPWCLKDRCAEILLELIPRCLSAAHGTLGTHPFSRLDVLIVPSNFSSLGMASPHIIFLSQSILTGGSHLCGTRLCHEIAHAWFGLAIGARDWTEEWISEGFATYLEDVFWAVAQQQLPHDEAREQQELKALLRWRRLRDEVQNSEEELQVLRPNKENTGEVSESGTCIIKHGLNAEKIFMQVHYLKGYFLLQSLAKRIGEATYFEFLRKFVQKFHGQLILSQDFLYMLLEDIPEQKGYGLSVENIIQTWLDTSGIPKPLLEECQTWDQCRLVQQVNDEVTKWIQVNQRARKRSKRKRRQDEVTFQKLLPDQLVLLLESLLEEKTLCLRTLQCLEKTYHLDEQDAEVRHRWCELVVKHKYRRRYADIEKFLKEDQAMGVYLYGELMVNEDAKQQELAYKCFAATQNQMDVSSAKVVAEMLF
ncbi:aminopeptidase O isoform X4 [Gopherus flavomarginatus]|uniref:aminopeptidase O isoform X4 n=1 Tax=Gopherus flavomarginatus TaxID=286002 RepID=UPI0021CBF07F|nr:aminopeptidase O isoform X4 [Gopherus flavomarginatus]